MNTSSVQLRDARSASHLLHRVLLAAAARHPELAAAAVPADERVFKKHYGDHVSRFEAARLASADAVNMARTMTDLVADAMSLGEVPLRAALATPAAAPTLLRQGSAEGPGAAFEIPFEGELLRGAEARTLLSRLHAEHHMSQAAYAGLVRMYDHVHDRGALDLRGHKFAILGAAAELSPAALLLRAGAEVLWVDPKPPPADLTGALVHAEGAGDLLGDPAAVLAAVKAFAGNDAVHLGLFAYAPGKSRELCLAESMNALVDVLGPARVRSVSMFVSPTSPGAVCPEDREVATARGHKPAGWQRALAFTGVLKGPGRFGADAAPVARAVISLQGAGYQAAQYLSKKLRAEVLAHDGVRVSANVAGISRTRSLEHPLFLAAFEGAPAFGVRIFDAPTTQALGAWLMLHDLLIGAPHQQHTVHHAQIHGGCYDLPWQFESAVRAAAVLGAARRPSLLWSRR